MFQVARRVTFSLTLGALLSLGAPAFAQQSETSREEAIRALEEKLEELQSRTTELIEELEALKAGEELEAPPEDLTQVEPITQETPPPSVVEPLDSAPVQNPPPASGKIFNPDIAVIGNAIAALGDENPFEQRSSVSLEEAELSLEAFVDPYAKARFFIGIGEEGVELEEGYAQFINLPSDFTAKVGKMKATFGKINTTHFHVRPWVDQPLVLERFFGEGMADSGISVSRLFPTAGALFIEGTAEIFRGEVEEVFEPTNRNDLLYVGHVKVYRDLSDNSNLELGGSYANGSLAENAGRSAFTAVDATFRWKPLEKSIYRSFIGRAELMANNRDDVGERALGYYVSGDYQFARRWLAGARLDSVEDPHDPALNDRGAALTLTFRPSEFSLIRAQLRHVKYAEAIDVNELLVQLQFGIGAHGAHPF